VSQKQKPLAERIGAVLFRLRGLVPVPFLLVLVLFARPAGWSWAVGLPLIIAGELLRFWGVGYAGGDTRSYELKAKRLCTRGPFAYIRNPLYVGNFLMALGTVVISRFLPLIIAQPLFYLFHYYFIIRFEEPFLAEEFGEDFSAYRKKVRRVIPRLRPYPIESGREFRAKNGIRNERATIIGQVFILVILLGLQLLLAANAQPSLWHWLGKLLGI